MTRDESISTAVALFGDHYCKQFGGNTTAEAQDVSRIRVRSTLLKEDNGPVLLVHGKKTTDAVVLVHGLTDSPYYMSAIGRRFFEAGVNVILPLLPGHGLKEPGAVMQDSRLAERWKTEVGQAVAIARLMGHRISIGGLSTGGALSINQALQHPGDIDGGLFLFSAALNVGIINEIAGRSRFIVPMLTKYRDGDYRGVGSNPYKYPKFSQLGAYQLIRIIRENRRLSKKIKLFQPVFAAHSIDDTSAQIKGVVDLFKIHKGNRLALVISETPLVSHADVVLETDIVLDKRLADADAEIPRANPNFNGMMTIALGFFKDYVQKYA